jgi:hypothetical protein
LRPAIPQLARGRRHYGRPELLPSPDAASCELSAPAIISWSDVSAESNRRERARMHIEQAVAV